MKIYKTKTKKLSGTDFREIHRNAFAVYQKIRSKTKRRPYIRSAYFDKEKIFLGIFWNHLHEKNYWDQMRRMKFFGCAIELVQKSRHEPTSKENPNKHGEVLHRFAGISADNELFFVQIKENRSNNQKSLISVFPIEKWK